MSLFKLKSPYPPRGDQPLAIEKLTEGLLNSFRVQTLLGVTGSGKTFTMANVINNVRRPTLVITHNKTLAAQLCNEFKEFFPENAVEYFVSYYDYYQPEAYIPGTDTYIEKDSSINDEIDRLRHSATHSVLERSDVIVVASVSCIYGLGTPEEYREAVLVLKTGEEIEFDSILKRLVGMQYNRNDFELSRGQFSVKGDILEVFPADGEKIIRIDLWGDEITGLSALNPVSGEIGPINIAVIYPARHFLTMPEKLEVPIINIRKELEGQIAYFEGQGKLLEAQRIKMRTEYDIEMLLEAGYCKGIENYSRHLSGRPSGDPPATLLDYFPKDYLIIIDESHVTIPQLHGMNAGDRSRKKNLIEYGFRLPSAYDNRPLRFEEFQDKLNQIIYVSATPGVYELSNSTQIVEQIIRPTGLVDPQLILKPTINQVDDLICEIRLRSDRNERVLVTTLTKKMAENLTNYLHDLGIKVRYLHCDIGVIERIKILRELRLGLFDVLVGINLLREGLDLPEVSLVAILDADKEGFLRSETSLVQTIGRAARNVSGTVILYGDRVTGSMARAMGETERRRKLQILYNQQYNIIPETIRKEVSDILDSLEAKTGQEVFTEKDDLIKKPVLILKNMAGALERAMKEAAKGLEFEKAAAIRDEMFIIMGEIEKRKSPKIIAAEEI